MRYDASQGPDPKVWLRSRIDLARPRSGRSTYAFALAWRLTQSVI
jgi:hypothetical protein